MAEINNKRQNKITDRIIKGAAAIILCGAFAASMAFSMTDVRAMESTAQESRKEEPNNDEEVRMFKYRTLKALNELRDMGFTPQAIWDEICTLSEDKDLENAQPSDNRETKEGGTKEGVSEEAGTGSSDMLSKVTEKAGETAQAIGRQASDAAKKAGEEAADKAAEEVKKQAGNVIDSFADKMSEAFQNFIDSIFNAGGK